MGWAWDTSLKETVSQEIDCNLFWMWVKAFIAIDWTNNKKTSATSLILEILLNKPLIKKPKHH